MTSELENSSAGTRRTRRNLMKMGAILVPATVGRVHSAAAGPLCGTFLGPFLPWCDPPKKGGNANCLLKGTKIQTVDGERGIEDLAIGDQLPTMFGGLRPIRWIGRYPIKKSDPSKRWLRDALPIRIARSALGPNVPHADLYVTGRHSLLIDGLLVPARCLVNGETITRHEAANEWSELEFFHIKLESHDVIYAEGAPVDTLLRVDESAVNFAEYFRQYGSATSEEARCAPYANFGGGRGELKSRMRSAISPWLDRRAPVDVIRDRLEERALMPAHEAEPG